MSAFKEFCKNMLLGYYTQAATAFFYQIVFVLGIGLTGAWITYKFDSLQTDLQNQQLHTQRLINQLNVSNRQYINEMYFIELARFKDQITAVTQPIILSYSFEVKELRP